MKPKLERYVRHEIGPGFTFITGRLPDSLIPGAAQFEALWQMHPQEFHEIEIHGRSVKTPRWQQAFGTDYRYSGRVNQARPIPAPLEPFLRWSREHIDPALNGVLVNWYDASLGHYIGPHRDSTKNMLPGSPIVTISLGDERVFRLRQWRTRAKSKPADFPARNGTVFIMPWETNCSFTHEVPKSRHNTGRRISITLRAFLGEMSSRTEGRPAVGLLNVE